MHSGDIGIYKCSVCAVRSQATSLRVLVLIKLPVDLAQCARPAAGHLQAVVAKTSLDVMLCSDVGPHYSDEMLHAAVAVAWRFPETRSKTQDEACWAERQANT